MRFTKQNAQAYLRNHNFGTKAFLFSFALFTSTLSGNLFAQTPKMPSQFIRASGVNTETYAVPNARATDTEMRQIIEAVKTKLGPGEYIGTGPDGKSCRVYVGISGEPLSENYVSLWIDSITLQVDSADPEYRYFILDFENTEEELKLVVLVDQTEARPLVLLLNLSKRNGSLAVHERAHFTSQEAEVRPGYVYRDSDFNADLNNCMALRF